MPHPSTLGHIERLPDGGRQSNLHRWRSYTAVVIVAGGEVRASFQQRSLPATASDAYWAQFTGGPLQRQA